jgi:mannose/fructose-specific phosphotransferase system component IIA
MTELLRGVVVGHGDLAGGLVSAVEEISGVRDCLIAVSNAGCDRDRLEDRIIAAVGDRPAIVFVDMPSGSCLFAALRRLRDRPSVRVVTGVNLAMLLDFVFHREAEPEVAAARAVETGAKSVGVR